MRIYDLTVNSDKLLVITMPPISRNIPGMDKPTAWVSMDRGVARASPHQERFTENFNQLKRVARMAEGFVVRPSALPYFVETMAYLGSQYAPNHRGFPIAAYVSHTGPKSDGYLDMIQLFYFIKPATVFLIAEEGDLRGSIDIYLDHDRAIHEDLRKPAGGD